MVAKQIEEQMSDRDNDIRILEWLGWEWFYSSRSHSDRMLCRPEDNEGHWTPVTTDVPIDEFTLQGLPRLSESLDECFRWIVPALSAQGWLCAVENTDDTDRFVADLVTEALTGHEGYRHVDREADTPAKAIVAAVCAYLDGEGK